MRTSLKPAIVPLLAIAIFAGFLVFPTGVSCQISVKRSESIIQQNDEPQIYWAEPGELPIYSPEFLVSGQGISTDTQKLTPPQDAEASFGKDKSRYMQIVLFYLRNFSFSPFSGILNKK